MKERNETEDGERERRKGGKREESRRVKEEKESYIYIPGLRWPTPPSFKLTRLVWERKGGRRKDLQRPREEMRACTH